MEQLVLWTVRVQLGSSGESMQKILVVAYPTAIVYHFWKTPLPTIGARKSMSLLPFAPKYRL